MSSVDRIIQERIEEARGLYAELDGLTEDARPDLCDDERSKERRWRKERLVDLANMLANDADQMMCERDAARRKEAIR